MRLSKMKILTLAALLILFLAIGFTLTRPKPEAADPLTQSDANMFFPHVNNPFAEKNLAWLNEQWIGDFEAMSQKNVIRALVPYSKTFYFLDGIDQRGLSYEMLKAFEKFINKDLKRNIIQVKIVIIPTKRDRLIPDLINGLGDIAVGNLTITPERQKRVDFSNPGLSGVEEILVTGPGMPAVKTLEGLSGKPVYVRESSSYHESLKRINAQFKKKKLNPITIEKLDELLEDEDILEMMNAGIIPMTVIDSHKANCWTDIFKDLSFCHQIKLRENGQIAWAVRKNSPQLRKKINAFGKTHKKGTLMGNILFNRYLGTCKWVSNPMEKDAFHRFEESVSLFKKYSEKYNFDWLMIAALAYQESRINQNMKSPSGAVGVMQILPATAADHNVNITDIHTMEGNIHAGIKYLAFLRDRYFEKEPMDELNQMFFTLASYNAGPAKIAKLRRQAVGMNLDPDIWFDNVEIVTAKHIGRETVQYVSNIYKYYIAYRMIVDADKHKKEIKKQYTAG
ncbi:MAG: transporter substrate-binding domain-containing protein [Desulfobacteraceae bacterium]|nr:transporter substrate-binding domain-containing protein [Desulfobacteraceae bacterium]MBC2757714.1 transporter substrate-binding domain-containing protein [Desulfobacteraceae bacterium]